MKKLLLAIIALPAFALAAESKSPVRTSSTPTGTVIVYRRFALAGSEITFRFYFNGANSLFGVGN
jgi:hypothetical protein